ncbi:hypothetical protein MCOR24_011294 [Pyricularia oryzae]|nr:hypothetical protein MCOR24_011294 [Pyricularia oryzae]
MAVLNLQRLLAGLQLITVVTSAAVELGYRAVATDLERLVKYSTVGVSVRQRWSEFDAPMPVVVVNATCESDIKAVVKYCSKNKVPLLPQNGGNGWASLKFNTPGVVLNLAGLNQVVVNWQLQLRRRTRRRPRRWLW